MRFSLASKVLYKQIQITTQKSVHYNLTDVDKKFNLPPQIT